MDNFCKPCFGKAGKEQGNRGKEKRIHTPTLATQIIMGSKGSKLRQEGMEAEEMAGLENDARKRRKRLLNCIRKNDRDGVLQELQWQRTVDDTCLSLALSLQRTDIVHDILGIKYMPVKELISDRVLDAAVAQWDTETGMAILLDHRAHVVRIAGAVKTKMNTVPVPVSVPVPIRAPEFVQKVWNWVPPRFRGQILQRVGNEMATGWSVDEPVDCIRPGEIPWLPQTPLCMKAIKRRHSAHTWEREIPPELRRGIDPINVYDAYEIGKEDVTWRVIFAGAGSGSGETSDSVTAVLSNGTRMPVKIVMCPESSHEAAPAPAPAPFRSWMEGARFVILHSNVVEQLVSSRSDIIGHSLEFIQLPTMHDTDLARGIFKGFEILLSLSVPSSTMVPVHEHPLPPTITVPFTPDSTITVRVSLYIYSDRFFGCME